MTSSTTRFAPGTLLVIRVEVRASSSQGSRVQSAVMASSLDTGRSSTGCLSRLLRGDRSAVPDLLTAADASLDPSGAAAGKR